MKKNEHMMTKINKSRRRRRGLIRQAKQFQSSGISVIFIFVITCIGKQLVFRMPSNSEGWCVARDLRMNIGRINTLHLFDRRFLENVTTKTSKIYYFYKKIRFFTSVPTEFFLFHRLQLLFTKYSPRVFFHQSPHRTHQ